MIRIDRFGNHSTFECIYNKYIYINLWIEKWKWTQLAINLKLTVARWIHWHDRLKMKYEEVWKLISSYLILCSLSWMRLRRCERDDWKGVAISKHRSISQFKTWNANNLTFKRMSSSIEMKLMRGHRRFKQPNIIIIINKYIQLSNRCEHLQSQSV